MWLPFRVSGDLHVIESSGTSFNLARPEYGFHLKGSDLFAVVCWMFTRARIHQLPHSVYLAVCMIPYLRCQKHIMTWLWWPHTCFYLLKGLLPGNHRPWNALHTLLHVLQTLHVSECWQWIYPTLRGVNGWGVTKTGWFMFLIKKDCLNLYSIWEGGTTEYILNICWPDSLLFWSDWEHCKDAWIFFLWY